MARIVTLLVLCSSLAVVSSAMLYRVRGGPESAGQLEQCPQGQFRSPNLIGPSCLPCSECPRNHIVRRLCTKDADTECTPFFEFESFHLLPPLDEEQQQQQQQQQQQSNDNNDVENLEGTSLEKHAIWLSELCYSLIASLVVVCLFFSAVIYYLLWRNKRSQSKMITVPDNADPTIYYHAREILAIVEEGTTTVTVLPRVPHGTTMTVPSSLVHIEAQLQRNTQHRSFVGRLLGDNGPQSPGNEYVEESYRVRLSSSATNDSDINASTPLVPEEMEDV